jgi:hypothetical protein
MHHCLWEESYVLDSKSPFVALSRSLFYMRLTSEKCDINQLCCDRDVLINVVISVKNWE